MGAPIVAAAAASSLQQHACPICSQRFVSPLTLQQHMAQHTQQLGRVANATTTNAIALSSPSTLAAVAAAATSPSTSSGVSFAQLFNSFNERTTTTTANGTFAVPPPPPLPPPPPPLPTISTNAALPPIQLLPPAAFLNFGNCAHLLPFINAAAAAAAAAAASPSPLARPASSETTTMATKRPLSVDDDERSTTTPTTTTICSLKRSDQDLLASLGLPPLKIARLDAAAAAKTLAKSDTTRDVDETQEEEEEEECSSV